MDTTDIFALLPGLLGPPPGTEGAEPAPDAMQLHDGGIPTWADVQAMADALTPEIADMQAIDPPTHAPRSAAQPTRFGTGTDLLVGMLSPLTHAPCVRAWLRLAVDQAESRPLPAAPGAVILFARDVDRLVRRQLGGRAALVAALEHAERRYQQAAPPAPTAAQPIPAVPAAASSADAAAVDQLLEREPAARAWLRRVVETDPRAPLPEAPANLGYFAAAVDVIRAHADGRAMLRTALQRAEHHHAPDAPTHPAASPPPGADVRPRRARDRAPALQQPARRPPRGTRSVMCGERLATSKRGRHVR